MNEQFEQLVNYIKQQLNQQLPEDNIRQTLLQHNWDESLINKAFISIKSPALPPVYPQAVQYPAPTVNTQPFVGQTQPQQTPFSTPAAVNSTAQLQADPLFPKKYRVFRALKDTVIAIKNNAVTFILALVISYAVALVSLLLISLLISSVFYGPLGLLFASASKLLAVLFASLILYTVWYAFAYAFVISATSLAIYDGAEKRKSSIKSIIKSSFTRMGKVVLTNILVALVSFWPLILIIFLPLILLSNGHSGNTSSILVLILGLVAIVWVYIAIVRYSLAPYIALFEPDVSATKTLGRSKFLLHQGGQWFIVKGFLLIILVSIILSAITSQNLQELRNSNNLTVNISFIIMTILANGALVMLYRNRKTIKG